MRLAGTIELHRHPRASGDPVQSALRLQFLGSRLRGNDGSTLPAAAVTLFCNSGYSHVRRYKLQA